MYVGPLEISNLRPQLTIRSVSQELDCLLHPRAGGLVLGAG
jgi:hypothetical protein